MCRRAKHLQQLYAYSQNTLNDTHTYKKGGGGGGTCECPHLDPPMMMVLQIADTYT